MAFPGVMPLIDAAHGDKRSLRTTDDDDVDNADDDDDDGEDLDSEDEDRMFRLNGGDKDLLAKIRMIPGAEGQIISWRTAEKTVKQLKNELDQTPEMIKLINLYAAVVMRNHHVVRNWN